MSGRFHGFLVRVAEAARTGCPAAWDELRRVPVPPIDVRIDGEVLCVVPRPDGPVVLPRGAPAPIRVETAGDVLVEVLLGERALIDALCDGRLAVYGAAADLAHLDRFARLLVAGAARSPQAAGLAEELLQLPGAKAA